MKLWMTYSWNDNDDGDVDYIVQLIEESGVQVSLDRWNITAGKRLWPQIESNITDKDKCDAWAIFLTQNSLSSQACIEEIYNALARALKSRGQEFPLIAIVDTDIDRGSIPNALNIRLNVSLEDKNWVERIKAAVEGRLPQIARNHIDPYSFKVHNLENDRKSIEVRPRTGSWMPFIFAIPQTEAKEILENPNEPMDISIGPTGGPPTAFALTGLSFGKGNIEGQEVIYCTVNMTVNRKVSAYLKVKGLPSQVWFGEAGSNQLFFIRIKTLQ